MEVLNKENCKLRYLRMPDVKPEGSTSETRRFNS
jgi:hypothetical protein